MSAEPIPDLDACITGALDGPESTRRIALSSRSILERVGNYLAVGGHKMLAFESLGLAIAVKWNGQAVALHNVNRGTDLADGAVLCADLERVEWLDE